MIVTPDLIWGPPFRGGWRKQLLGTAGASEAQFRVRAKPYKLQCFVIGFPVDQHEIGFYVTIAVILPIAGERVITMLGIKGPVLGERPHHLDKI